MPKGRSVIAVMSLAALMRCTVCSVSTSSQASLDGVSDKQLIKSTLAQMYVGPNLLLRGIGVVPKKQLLEKRRIRIGGILVLTLYQRYPMRTANEQIIAEVLRKIEEERGDVTHDALVAYSGFSYFHFHRLFVAYVGESLAHYLKRIRLERAVHDLKYKKIPVTTVALDAGYATPPRRSTRHSKPFSASIRRNTNSNNPNVRSIP